MWVAFANAKATHIFFSKNISVYAIFNDQSFNDTFTNVIASFEQLGPGQNMKKAPLQKAKADFGCVVQTLCGLEWP